MKIPTLTLQELLKLVRGECVPEQNSTNQIYKGVAPLHLASVETISFFSNEKYLNEARKTRAGVVLCTKEALAELSQNTTSIFVVCANPYAAFAKISQVFFKPNHSYSGISPQAIIDSSAQVPSSATIFPNAFVAPGAIIGERTVLYPGSFVGAGSSIGDDCILYPNAVVREGCHIGNGCILNPGAVVGGDGFGFAPTETENVKIPHIGGVQIADHVELGANSAIDRGTIQDTTVGRETKIDNMVTIGHNAEIGEFCLIAGQTGIAGSAKIGNRVVVAGQVGVSGHLTIGDKAVLGPQAGVTKSIPPGETWLGSPARPYREFAKSIAVLSRMSKAKEKVK